jgi:hypothetical protein
MRHKFKKLTKEIELHRIENSVEIGTPDLFGRSMFHDFWIELKATDAPVREATPFLRSDSRLRPDQINWIHSYSSKGGIAYILVREKTTKVPYLVCGHHAKNINTWTEGTFDRLSVAIGWPAVVNRLINETKR